MNEDALTPIKPQCPKCGSTDVDMKYDSYDDVLFITCSTCCYEWAVEPLTKNKDEEE